MAAAEKSYALEQGSTFAKAWQFRLKGTTTFRDLTGYLARLQLRRGGPNGDVLLTVASDLSATALGSSLVILDPAAATALGYQAAHAVVLTITDEESAAMSLPDEAELRGDLELVPPSGQVERALKGTWTFDLEATR